MLRTLFTLNTLTNCLILALVGLMSGYAPSASAGQFSVSPVRIFLVPRDRATAVSVKNESNEELRMEADLYKWTQNDKGEEVLTLTEDLVMSPPVVKLGPKSKQVVRLALLKPRPAGEQLTYRIIVRELVEAKISTQEKPEVPIAIAFSMPIFITPNGLKPKVGCTISRPNALVTCENSGKAYTHVREFELKNAAGEKIAALEQGGYLLAGSKRSFDLKPVAATVPAGAAKLQVKLDDGQLQTFDVTLAE
jgi:fimbrial chaperone protein